MAFMRRYLAHLLAQSFAFSDRVVDLIKDTALVVSAPGKDDGGAAVLISPKTVLTVTRNLQDADLGQFVITRPASGEISGLRKVTAYENQGLAILELRESFMAPYADVSRRNDPKEGTPVAMPLVFGRAGENAARNATDITLVKGFLMKSGAEEGMLSSVFHLRSGNIDTGAGIFDQNGFVLTLRRNGDDLYETKGIPLAVFRTILK